MMSGTAREDTTNPAAAAGRQAFQTIENVWIPMSDGVRLAARLWLPEGADRNPVPALLNYTPYRKRDVTRLAHDETFPYLAAHGYACIHVDIRGSGDSDGLKVDEYVQRELDDAVEVIAWLAAQRWCSGKVGMFGSSYGGFTSLQVAALRPPALKAIVTRFSTDDRYTEDCHYKNGTLNDCMFAWGTIFFAYLGLPPDPVIVGDRWRGMWMERLEGMDFPIERWLENQHRNSFWKHGSINEDYDAITCPVYAVGGWADPYSNAVPRLLSGLKVPRKGLIGPWSHSTRIGPTIDYETEYLRWWDHWLKDIDTGLMDEPMYRVWMQNEAICCGAKEVGGRWVAEESWPSPRIVPKTFFINGTGLESHPGVVEARSLTPLQTVGITAPVWAPFKEETELPTDQRIDDARSLTFDSAPLESELEILGAPIATLELAVDKPVAFLFVRLNEVSPNGPSLRVTSGMLNLTQRNSNENPQPLEPGRRYRISLPLDDRAFTFKRGHRLRIAISTTHWPMIWPSPESVTLTLYTGASELKLPVRPKSKKDDDLRPLAAFVARQEDKGWTLVDAEASASRGSEAYSVAYGLGGDVQTKEFSWDPATGTLTIRSENPGERVRINATGTEIHSAWSEVTEIRDTDPTSAKLEYRRRQILFREDWNIRVEAVARLSLTKEHFVLTGDLQAFEGDSKVFSKIWDRQIPRTLL